MDDSLATKLEDALDHSAVVEAPSSPSSGAVAKFLSMASLDRVLDQYQQQQSPKTCLAELSFLKSTLQHEAWFLPDDWQESVLGQIEGGLRCDNSQVRLQALECLVALTPQLTYYELTPYATELSTAVAEVLGDSRPSVRSRAREVLALFMEKVGEGSSSVLKGLRPTVGHRNPRLRQEMASFLVEFVLPLLSEFSKEERQLLLEILVALVADTNAQVRSHARQGLEQVVTGTREQGREGGEPEVLAELKKVGLKGPHLKQLQQMLTEVGEGKEEGAADSSSSSSDDEFLPSDMPSVELLPPSASSMVPVDLSQAPVSRSVGAIPPPPPPGVRLVGEKECKVSEHVDAPSEVVPVAVRSDKELAQEMQSIAVGLTASEDDWQVRTAALHRVQGLAVGGGGRLPTFVPGLRAIQQLLTQQILSLRSTLSREGCLTVAILAQVLGDDMLPLADLWAPAVLKTTQVNISVMALSADQCLRCLVSCTRQGFPRLLPILLEGTTSKNDTERLRCVAAITLALWHWDAVSFDRAVDAVGVMLKAAVADKKEPVRAAARQCFWAFRRKFPGEADEVLESLDPNRQKAVRKEQHLATSASVAALVPTTRYTVVSQYSSSELAATPAALAEQDPAGPGLSRAGETISSHPTASTTVLEAHSTTTSAPTVGGTVFHRGPRRQSLSGGGALRVVAPAKAQPPGPSASGLAGSTGMGGGGEKTAALGGPKRGGRSGAVPPSGPPHQRGNGPKPPKAPSHPAPGGPPPVPTGLEAPEGPRSSSLSASAPSEEATRPAPGRRLSITGPLRVVRPTGPQASVRTEGKTPAHVPANKPAETGTGSLKASGGGTGSNTRTWEEILQDADSTVWNLRARGLEDAAAKLHLLTESNFPASDSSSSSSSSSSFPALILDPPETALLVRFFTLVTHRLQDANQRVAHAALEVAAEFLLIPSPAFLAEAVPPALDPFLARVLHKTGDPKEQVRTLAHTIIRRCQAVLEPSLLAASLARTCHDQPAERAKAVGLELLETLVPAAASFFAHGPALRSLMNKLSTLILAHPRPLPAVERAASSCLVALWKTQHGAFMEHLGNLPAEPQMAVRRVLQQQQQQLHPNRQQPRQHQHGTRQEPPPKAPQTETTPGEVTGWDAVPDLAQTHPSRGRAEPAHAPPHPGRRSPSSTTGVAATGSVSSSPHPASAPPHPPRSRLPDSVNGEDGANAAKENVETQPEGNYGLAPFENAPTFPPGSEAGGRVESKKKARPQAPGVSRDRARHVRSEKAEESDVRAAWALRTLVDELAPPGGKGQALEELMALMGEGGPDMWDRYFQATMTAFMTGLQQVPGAAAPLTTDTCPLLQGAGERGLGSLDMDVWGTVVKPAQGSKAFPTPVYLSLRGLRHLLRVARSDPPKARSFLPYLPSLLPSLLACASTSSLELFQHAEKVLTYLFLLLPDPGHLYRSLSALLTPATPHPLPRPHLLLALRTLPKLLARLPSTPGPISSTLPALLPVLVHHLNDPDIVMRMATVSFLAALHPVLGDDLFPLLHPQLRPAQLKLVSIYVDKTVTQQEEGRGHEGGREGGRDAREPLAAVHVQ